MKKSGQPPEKRSSHQSIIEDLISTPINIARARYASTYGESVVDKKEQVTVLVEKKTQQSKSKSRPAQRSATVSEFSYISPSSCLFVALLGMTFLTGGILGGAVGGGMLLWFGRSNDVRAVSAAPTPTTLPTPTPAPAEKPPTPTPTPKPQPAATPSVEDIIAKAIPSVVTVINQQNNSFLLQGMLDEGRVVGSGVVIDPRGYIATNNHVVDKPGELSTVLADGRVFPAELIAANPAEDLAIIKIGLSDLQPIEWGDSTKVRPGQIVYAIGSPLGDFPNSVSFGIVSGLNRALEIDKFVIDGLIQTDAAINRGSSGGPLINLEGKVVGINTFIIRESEERGIAEGIAFSIPADTAKNLLIPWIAAHTGESIPIPASEGQN